MKGTTGKIFLILSMLLAFVSCQQNLQRYSDNEVPDVLSHNSPLRRPESLKSRPYFDFLSVLYRRDADKSQLFTPYTRNSRAAVASSLTHQQKRNRRAIVFRPLFVYRQQEVRKQNQARRRI